MYFHTDDPSAILFLANVLEQAVVNESRIRINVDAYGNLIIKRGEGGWTAPLASTPDPYRDASPEQRPAYGRTLLRDIE